MILLGLSIPTSFLRSIPERCILEALLRRVLYCGHSTQYSHLVLVLLSRVCAVAQYAVLEANGKVNGIGEISNPYRSQTLGPIWMPLQIYHYVRSGSRCAKFNQNREKNADSRGFFVYISICLSVLHHAYRLYIFSAILTLNGSYDVFLQPLVPFGVAMR